MSSTRARLIVLIASLVVAVPITVLVTFLALPLWSALEARAGIEAVGHSGPARWCFCLVYLATVAAWNLLGPRVRRRGSAAGSD